MKKLLLSAILAAACVTTDVNAKDAATETILKTQMGECFAGPISHVNTSIVGLVDAFSQWAKNSAYKGNKKDLNNAVSALKKIAKFTGAIMSVDKEKSIDKKVDTASQAADAFGSSVKGLKEAKSFWKTHGSQLRDTVRNITFSLQMLAQKDVKVKVAGATYSSAEGLKEDGGATAQYTEFDPKFLSLNNGEVKVSKLLARFKEIYTAVNTVSSSATETVTRKDSTSSTASKR